MLAKQLAEKNNECVKLLTFSLFDDKLIFEFSFRQASVGSYPAALPC
jgi:hypothetical protein